MVFVTFQSALGHHDKFIKNRVPLHLLMCFCRVAGLKQRDGPGVIVSLPIKLVPPGSAPPPEAAQELMDSSLLRRLSATRVTTLFSDGAPAWPKAVKAVPGNIKAVAVSHKNVQFTRKWCLKNKPSKISSVAGTQCVDRWWNGLDRFTPSQLHGKQGKGGAINENLYNYVFAFVWRDQLPHDADMRAEIGALCARRE